MSTPGAGPRFATNAAQYGRADALIESGIIIFCRLAPSRRQALEEVPRYLRQFGAVGEQFISRGAFGTPDDIRECIEAYIKVGLNKFVLRRWPVPMNTPAR